MKKIAGITRHYFSKFENRESEKVFARIFDEFLSCSGLPKTSIFIVWTIQNIITRALTPPPVF